MESEFFKKDYSRDLVEISIGGEIGEIGGKNSTSKEMRCFIEGFNKEMERLVKRKKLSKISVQTGASHGGIVDEKGKVVRADIDFEVLKKLSDQARKYGMGGAVQHGSSTLPEEYFDKFPKTGAVEIHLATAFQNIIFDSLYFPKDLREKVYKWVNNNFISHKKESQTEQQFLYKNRKRALGHFKKEIWQIPQKNIDKISEELEDKFSLIFHKLGVEDTVDLIKEIYS
jgi:fructose/tagatose bisphosphate aldolase